MASYTANRGVHKTLSGSTADVVTLTMRSRRVEVINRSSASGPISVSFGSASTIPTLLADDTEIVLPSSASNYDMPNDGVIKIVGVGNDYSVVAVDR